MRVKPRGKAASNKPSTCLRRGLTKHGLALPRCPSFGVDPTEYGIGSDYSSGVIVRGFLYNHAEMHTSICLLKGCHDSAHFISTRFSEWQ